MNGSQVKLQGADARAALHVQPFPYEATFTAIDDNGTPVPDIYPIHGGVLTSFPAETGGTSKVFNNSSPSDWTVSIPHQQKSCDHCGEPQIRV